MFIKKPLWEQMEKYWQQMVYPFHTPGHKGGRGAAPELRDILGPKALSMDVSLMDELDDLHHPSRCLKEAQELAANLYGADKSYFSVNGTTGAIHAMLLGALKPQDKILVPRNSHSSVIGGLILGDFRPVYIMPEYSQKWGLSLQVSPEQIDMALGRNQDIKAVLITSPNYYGLCTDVEAISKVCHRHGVVLLVDEAHGAHLGFSELLPPSALSCGADAVSQSTHKILGALTQCSMLHITFTHLDETRMDKAMSLVTTTSPNYLLLASLDLARAQLEEKGTSMVEAAIDAADTLRDALSTVPYIRVLNEELVGEGGVVAMDKTKVTVNVTALGISGKEVGDILRKAGIAVELVDQNNVLFLVTYADQQEAYDSVVDKIVDVFQSLSNDPKEALPLIGKKLPTPLPVITPAKAFYSSSEEVDFKMAVGEISAEQISFYPPGIPIIVPGERITSEVIDYCLNMMKIGVAVSGPSDTTLQRVRVVKL